MPYPLAYVWRWYRELNRPRQNEWHGLEAASVTFGRNGAGAKFRNVYRLHRLAYGDINEWAQATRRVLRRSEVELLLRIDDAVFDVIEGRDIQATPKQSVGKQLKGALRMLAGDDKRQKRRKASMVFKRRRKAKGGGVHG